jgi:ribosomal protein L19
VKVYSVEKIVNARKKLSTGEKIERLIDIKNALIKKLKVLQSGGKIKDFDYLTPGLFKIK